MAQKHLHCKTKKVKYIFSGDRFIEIVSAYEKSDFLCETDIFIHPAWRKPDEKAENFGSKKVNQFNATFGGISVLNALKSESASKSDMEAKSTTEEIEEAVEEKDNTPAKPKKKKKN